MSDNVDQLLDRIRARDPLGGDDVSAFRRALQVELPEGSDVMYQNSNERLNIDFSVERVLFPAMETFDPRMVRIPPGKFNEKHRHAHESLFIFLEGEGEVLVGEETVPVAQGDIAFVPRWVVHQTRNMSHTKSLTMLAITDFNLTSAVLGNYDRRTRLSNADAEDALE